MILGIGHDLVAIERMNTIMVGEQAGKFVKRVLTEQELHSFSSLHTNSRRQLEYLSGRFAVKEAVSKAFGCGIGTQIGFQDVECLNAPSGKPGAMISNKALMKLGVDPVDHEQIVIHVSITHDDAYASAYVIVEQREVMIR